jgi:hypothetical protein
MRIKAMTPAPSSKRLPKCGMPRRKSLPELKSSSLPRTRQGVMKDGMKIHRPILLLYASSSRIWSDVMPLVPQQYNSGELGELFPVLTGEF